MSIFVRLLFLIGLLMGSGLFANTESVDGLQESPEAFEVEGYLDDGFEEGLEDEFSQEDEAEPFDPLSGYNRAMTSFNDAFYTNLLYPVARGYAYLMPEGGRIGLSRFFANLHFPIRFVNNILQLKMRNSADELMRFLINSTVGILGFFDPAKAWFDIEAHDEDLGQTLGFYGVGGGFPIVLPILGPSNLRDSVSILGNMYLDPLIHWDVRNYNLLKNNWQALGVKAIDITNEASLHPDEYESLRKDAVDLYPFFRNAYRQNREREIAK